jgi:Dyp-type peroxidase family
VTATDERLELDDIQGLVARGYGNLPYASYLLLTVTDRTAAARVLDAWARRTTPASRSSPDPALNVGLTARGIAALLPSRDGIPDGFSEQFRVGMVDEHRSRVLGDVGADDPGGWRWGGPRNPDVHLLLLVFAADADRLARLVAELCGEARAGLSVVTQLDAAPLSVQEPFGFHDGISQPLVAGLPKAAGDGGDVVTAGEFVLGYRNEYGLRGERPLLAPSDDPESLLPRDVDGSGAADLGRNGTYLVFRQLAQDVDGFWAWVTAATTVDGVPDPVRRDLLAAKLVGRWPSGAPLVMSPEHDDPGLADANDFGYHREDRHGFACPVGSHIRRANPRDSLDPRPGTEQSRRVNHRHRLVRRGRNYTGDGGGAAERGLYFQCLNANIARQFEFVQHTWLEDPAFNGLYDSPDPLVGTRHQGAAFVEQAFPVRRRHLGLPQFVHVRGGAYFFLPGLAALRYLASRAGATT